ncbi:MAG: hypothetical protein K2N05_08630 [Muribaculaceae bacterium]|nr:hypothetical protein [Muribaculaceae bacterium]
MKIKGLISLCLAGFAAAGFAQTHVEGEEYFKAGQYNNAFDLLERSLNNPATDKAVSNYYLGSYWILGKDNNKAREYFTKGIAVNPEYPMNYVGLGKLDLMQGNVKGAEAQFKLAEKFGKKNASVTTAIARAYYDVDKVGYEKQITKYKEKALKQDMKNPDYYIFLGDELSDANNINGASTQYDWARSYDPKSAVAYVKYAELFHKANPKLSIQMLKDLLVNNPTSALGQHELAETYEEQGDYKNATIEYGKYVNNPVHFKKDESKYSFLLYYDQQYQKGYDYATKLLKEDPSNYDAQRYQFMNAVMLPDLKDQLLPMAEALYATHQADPKKKPLSFVDYHFISNVLSNNGKMNEAIAVLKEGISDPNLEKFRPQLTNTLFDTYMRVVNKDMTEGMAEVKANNKENANRILTEGIEYAQKASEVNPESYLPYYRMGTLYNIMGDQTKGFELYEKAASLEIPNEGDAKILYKMLGDYFKAKSKDKAINFYNKYLELDPENVEVNAAMGKL